MQYSSGSGQLSGEQPARSSRWVRAGLVNAGCGSGECVDCRP